MAFRSCGCVVIFVQRAHGNITSISPYVRESTKVLDSGSQPLDSGSLDSGFQLSGFRIPYQSGFWIPNHCGFRILVSGFRIPTAKVCWIPDSGFSYMGRSINHMFLNVYFGKRFHTALIPQSPVVVSLAFHCTRQNPQCPLFWSKINHFFGTLPSKYFACFVILSSAICIYLNV